MEDSLEEILTRPSLEQLFQDISAKKIDVVVVYKVDHLTRSLMDSQRIVEQFDRQGVSFVSVTSSSTLPPQWADSD
jgi:site-specific DNA recombinase